VERVEDPVIRPDMTVRELIDAYSKIYGFNAGHLYRAIELLRKGLSRSRLRILTFTANLVSTGLRGIIADLIGKGLFNVVITTCGALDHDIARAVGGEYLKGFFEADDVELYEKGYHRLGNIYIPVESYGPKVESFVRKLVDKMESDGRDKWGTYEIARLAGSIIEDKRSILRAASSSGAYVFVPGWPDGAFGTSLFMEAQRREYKFTVDYFIDMKMLSDIFFSWKGEAAALIVGGGISKHHAIWWSQFRNGLDYAVYVTTAVEYDGSLSGAHPREAVTWGKIKPEGGRVVVYGDATIIFPIIAAGILDVRPATK